MTRPLSIVCALLFAAAGRAAALDLGDNQVLIEATLVSISRHEEMADHVDFFTPDLPIDLFTEIQVRNAAEVAAGQTATVITTIQGDLPLAQSQVGIAALGHLELARVEQLGLLELLDEEGFPIAQDVMKPVLAGLHLQVAAVNALQGRPERFPLGKRSVREAGEVWSEYTIVRQWLEAHDLPSDDNVLFEPFSGGKGKSLLERIGLMPGPDARAGIRDGRLELSARAKQPVTSGADFSFRLSDDFTILITFTLPERSNDKPRDELDGFSAGLKVTTDTSNDPAEAVFIEHQTGPDGWQQSFTSTKTAIVDVFPHAMPSPTREITNFIVKDGNQIVIGSLLKDGASETRIQSSIPVLGDLPVLGLYFRNGTKKAKLEADNLLIFVTPHVIPEP